jgi:hypothetical protein
MRCHALGLWNGTPGAPLASGVEHHRLGDLRRAREVAAQATAARLGAAVLAAA